MAWYANSVFLYVQHGEPMVVMFESIGREEMDHHLYHSMLEFRLQT